MDSYQGFNVFSSFLDTVGGHQNEDYGVYIGIPLFLNAHTTSFDLGLGVTAKV